MIDIQLYAWDAKGKFAHAGCHKVRRLTVATLVRLEGEHRTWKRKYLKEHPGDYPLRHTGPGVLLQGWPIGHEEQAIEARMSDKIAVSA